MIGYYVIPVNAW